MNSYRMCLEKAGANILAFEEFGDWQGSWLAKVEYEGEVGWVEGSYGSCCGCDSFLAEFEYAYEDTESLNDRYAEFGRSYLISIVTSEQQLRIVERYKDLCDDDAKMYIFVKENF